MLNSDRSASLKWLYGYVTPRRTAILAILALSLSATLIGVVQPVITKWIIDDALLKQNANLLITLVILLLGLSTCNLILSGFNRLQYTRLSSAVLFDLREDVFSHLLTLPPSYFHTHRVGDIASRLDRDVAEIQRFAIDTLFSSATAVIGLVASVGLMLWLSWQLSLLLLILIPVEALYLHKMRPKLQDKNLVTREKSADISAFLAEKLPHIKFIQTLQGEAQETSQLRSLNTRFLDALLGLQWIEIWVSGIPSLLVTCTRASVFVIGGYWVIEGQLALGSLIAFITYIGMAIGPVQSLMGLYLAWQRLVVSLDRVREIREAPGQHRLPTKTYATPQCLNGNLAFKAVHFAHNPSTPILIDCTADLPAGEKIGIMGASGVGKSTLLDLLLGFLDPNEGQIEFDGIPQSALPSDWLRQRIAYVPQEPVLFKGTLQENVAYGGARAPSDAQITQALIDAGLGYLLERLPKGIHSPVSERGTMLSGGEKQRIGIARALLKDPDIIVLDEPISATDLPVGLAVLDTIDRLFRNKTRIIVSHRLEAFTNADTILRLENGHLEVALP
jgi:ATP-binding cassette subfamily B protein